MSILKGKESLLAHLAKHLEVVHSSALRAMYQEGLALQTASMEETPVDTGRLRASAYTKAAEDQITVGYGTDYALAVHERVDVPHKTGKAKFLEDPYLRMQEGYLKRIADRIKADI